MCVGGTHYTPLSHTIFLFCSQKEHEKKKEERKKEKDGDKVERHSNSKVETPLISQNERFDSGSYGSGMDSVIELSLR